ncbi:hypothetical protein DEO72_LG2g1323 [Vigna unguiculata]|uniref:Uncharacterized protein n=1 Tax=Vigna unguiculata TaxID=3917 RepID=A0A4D6KYY3_VIGUN|nr:hypothetical protein DEO72_LG2g1323 [Vigna unguiculata]
MHRKVHALNSGCRKLVVQEVVTSGPLPLDTTNTTAGPGTRVCTTLNAGDAAIVDGAAGARVAVSTSLTSLFSVSDFC